MRLTTRVRACVLNAAAVFDVFVALHSCGCDVFAVNAMRAGTGTRTRIDATAPVLDHLLLSHSLRVRCSRPSATVMLGLVRRSTCERQPRSVTWLPATLVREPARLMRSEMSFV